MSLPEGLIENGRITAISPGADQPPSDGTTILNLRGYSVMPGIVGMHDHLFYMVRPNLAADNTFDGPAIFLEMSFSAPRLYLANGVTTARTTGSANPYTDLRLKQAIETGLVPGPHLDVTGPYLEGAGSNPNLQMHKLTGPEDARQTVAYWADRGVTSFKAYKNITREELSAAVQEAHRRGLKVTGHLCSVTYAEAVESGIDNLEHGFFVDTELDPGKKPDTCTDSEGDYTLLHRSPGSPEADQLIAMLVSHHVAVASTLPSTAASVPSTATMDGRPPVRPAVVEAMAPAIRDAYLYSRMRPISPQSNAADLLRRDMALERAFVAAGGLLLAGPDPASGAILPGFGDQREIELLVEGGFTPTRSAFLREPITRVARFDARSGPLVEFALDHSRAHLRCHPGAVHVGAARREAHDQEGRASDARRLLGTEGSDASRANAPTRSSAGLEALDVDRGYRGVGSSNPGGPAYRDDPFQHDSRHTHPNGVLHHRGSKPCRFVERTPPSSCSSIAPFGHLLRCAERQGFLER
jgi:hypothetical protein